MDGNLRPVKSDVDHELSGWYKDHSRVFVTHTHACWSDMELSRKVAKRRFGTVIRSDEKDLAGMMHAHADEVHQFIVDSVVIEDSNEEG